jgi:hypothetical protein
MTIVDETRTMKERHNIEEWLRMKVYRVMDTATLEPYSYEAMRWADIHDALVELAEYYESKGLKIWKH